MHEEVRLRVRAPAPVDGAIALRRLERRRLPELLLAGRDDVVVPVEQDRRCVRRALDLSDQDRGGVGQLERVEDGHARVPEQASDLLVRLEERRTRLDRIAGGGDSGNGDEPAEVLLEDWHQLCDLVPRRAAHGYLSPHWATAAGTLNDS